MHLTYGHFIHLIEIEVVYLILDPNVCCVHHNFSVLLQSRMDSQHNAVRMRAVAQRMRNGAV